MTTRHGASILVGQHDGDDTFGHQRVGRIGRVVGERLIEIIDFEHDPVAVGIEGTKVVFFMWIVGVAKVVVHRNRLDDALMGALRGVPARRHFGCAYSSRSGLIPRLILKAERPRALGFCFSRFHDFNGLLFTTHHNSPPASGSSVADSAEG